MFYVWRDGQKEYYSTDPELYAEGDVRFRKQGGKPLIRGALSWMQFAADVFKMGTTRYNPRVHAAELLRDAQGTAIQSEGWAMPFVATIKGLMLQLSNDPAHKKLIEDAINDGVFYSAITSLPKGTSIKSIAKELRRQRALASSTGNRPHAAGCHEYSEGRRRMGRQNKRNDRDGSRSCTSMNTCVGQSRRWAEARGDEGAEREH